MRPSPASSVSTRASWRVTALDRPRLPERGLSVAGPIDVPSRADLVRALRLIAACGPQARVGLQIDRAAARWIWEPEQLGRLCDEAVVEAAPPCTADLGTTLTDLAAQGATSPVLRFLRSDRYLFLDMVHALGDARLMTLLLTGVVEAARTGEAPAWARLAEDRHPLRAALLHRGGADRFRPGAAVRAMRPSLPSRDRSTGDRDRPWRPSVTAVYQRSEPGVLAEVRDWRRAHEPGMSRVPITFAAAHAALRAVGLRPQRRSLVLFDGRRYLPRGVTVNGNFVAGLDLVVGEAPTPADFHDVIEQAAVAGRPLTAMLAGLTVGRTLAAVSRIGGAPPTVPAAPRPYIAYSHVGLPPAAARLPWIGPRRDHVYTGLAEPAGPEGLTLVFAEIGDCLQVSASFHSGVFDRSRVAEALDLLCHDPISLLPRRAQRRAQGWKRIGAAMRQSVAHARMPLAPMHGTAGWVSAAETPSSVARPEAT